MSAKTLPSQPSLKSLKHQAKQLLRAHKAGQEQASQRLIAVHPDYTGLTPQAAQQRPLTHADALLVLAREYGHPSWPQLLEALEQPEPEPTNDPFASAPGWEWIIAPKRKRPLGSNGGTTGKLCLLHYENKPAHDGLTVHIAVGPEFITRPFRLIALEANGTRHLLTEHASGSCGFELALFGYRLPYEKVPHGTIQHLGVEAASSE